LELDRKLLAILRGEAQPADSREGLALARLCRQYKRRYAAAARLAADAFAADAFAAEPRLADDLRAGHRYHAACAAALAAAGQGEDAAKLDARERARLRGQALTWLRADVGAWAGRVEKGTPPERGEAVKQLRGWQSDPALAGVRDANALSKLSEAEREEWRRLWADVRALLAKARGKGTTGR
jgi:eukaryotic-like serine/threonine-protein kinase